MGIVMASITVVAVLTLFPPGSGAQEAAAASGKVAVCNLQQVFEEYDRATKLNEDFKERQNSIEAEIKARQNAIDETRKMLKHYKAGSEQAEKVQEKAQRQLIELNVYREIQTQSLVRDHARLTKEMFGEITEAISKVAKRKGFELVLHLEPRKLEGNNARDLRAQMINRKVLHNDSAIDLTGNVIQELNESYRGEPKKKTQPKAKE